VESWQRWWFPQSSFVLGFLYPRLMVLTMTLYLSMVRITRPIRSSTMKLKFFTSKLKWTPLVGWHLEYHGWSIHPTQTYSGIFDCKGLQWVTLPLLVKFLQTAFQARKTENKTSKLNISMKLKLHITFLNIRIHFNFNLAFVAFVLTSS